MLLPGISGSLLLLVLGMYAPITGAIHNFDLPIIAITAAGLICGAAVAVPVLKRLLARFHDRTMSLLSGLMAGSLVALWPWKAHYCASLVGEVGPMSPHLPSSAQIAGPVIMMVGGGALISLLNWLVNRSQPHTN